MNEETKTEDYKVEDLTQDELYEFLQITSLRLSKQTRPPNGENHNHFCANSDIICMKGLTLVQLVDTCAEYVTRAAGGSCIAWVEWKLNAMDRGNPEDDQIWFHVYLHRKIETHKVNGCNDAIDITVMDAPGAGGASHLYDVRGFNTGTNPSCPFTDRYGKPSDHTTILFQNGTIPENGTNGITQEVLLAIVIDRLECFQNNKFACIENQIAMDLIRSALSVLQSRTKARIRRQVEGTHTV